MSSKTFTFRGYVVVPFVTRYATPENPALRLTTEDGMPFATASVNPTELLNPGEIGIKSWAENGGMADALMAAGIIGPVLRTLHSGFVDITIHMLLVE